MKNLATPAVIAAIFSASWASLALAVSKCPDPVPPTCGFVMNPGAYCSLPANYSAHVQCGGFLVDGKCGTPGTSAYTPCSLVSNPLTCINYKCDLVGESGSCDPQDLPYNYFPAAQAGVDDHYACTGCP
jgi:hypothetical protein